MFLRDYFNPGRKIYCDLASIDFDRSLENSFGTMVTFINPQGRDLFRVVTESLDEIAILGIRDGDGFGTTGVPACHPESPLP